MIRLCDIIGEWFPHDRYKKYGETAFVCGHDRKWGDEPWCEIRICHRDNNGHINEDSVLMFIHGDWVEVYGKRFMEKIPIADPTVFDRILENLDVYLGKYYRPLRPDLSKIG